MISRNKKLSLYKTWKKKGCENSKLMFIRYRNIFNKSCREAKRLHYSRELHTSKSSPQKQWKIMKEAAGLKCKNNSETITQIIDSNGNSLSDPQKIANEFNTYFATIGKNTAKKVEDSNIDFRSYLTYKSNSFVLFPIGPFDIVKIVNELHDKSSKDINDISVSFLKKIIFYIADPLAHIFELSLNEGIFPSSFKINKTIPVFKRSGKIDEISNYRPISIVNCFAKILEKHLADSLLRYLIKEDLISDKQFGFMPAKNTSQCLFNVIGDISINSNENLYTALIMLDISKAFDTCSHDIIIEKLSSYGIRGIQLDLFRSFLKDRKQIVKIGDTSAEQYMSVDIGVPQGSMLGVLMFLIYINDINHASNFDLFLYADDSNALLSNADPQNLQEQCNIELSKLNDWFSSNKLMLNLKKSQLMVFSPNLVSSPRIDIYYKTKHEIITIDQIPNESKHSAKSLGILLDEKLTLKHYITELKKKINSSLFFLSRVKKYLTLDARKNLYFSLIHSKLIYCLPLLTLLRKTDMDSICTLQRKAIKIVFNVNQRSSSINLFHDLGTYPIDVLLEIEIMKTLQNIDSYGKPKSLIRFFDKNVNYFYYNLRYVSRFNIPLVRSIRLSSSPIYAFPSFYNRFPEEFKDIKERNIFLEYLSDYYSKNTFNNDCQKKYCKLCKYKEFIAKIKLYYTQPETPDYFRYR